MARLFIAAIAISTLSCTALLAGSLAGESVPAKKRTSLGLYITAQDAYAKWKADPVGVKIVDVRTPEEFRTIGFPEMAAKIPLSASADDFVGQFRQVVRPDDTILVICRSGNRSAMAVEMLARAGFKNAYTVIDGFEGDRDTDPASPNYGQRTVNGWKNAGLPWTR
jgi:rhodanese-related sulfurtransferase